MVREFVKKKNISEFKLAVVRLRINIGSYQDDCGMVWINIYINNLYEIDRTNLRIEKPKSKIKRDL